MFKDVFCVHKFQDIQTMCTTVHLVNAFKNNAALINWITDFSIFDAIIRRLDIGTPIEAGLCTEPAVTSQLTIFMP